MWPAVAARLIQSAEAGNAAEFEAGFGVVREAVNDSIRSGPSCESAARG